MNPAKPLSLSSQDVGNAPTFDPLAATPAEEAEMVAGYLAAGDHVLKPAITSVAFDHGWRMRRNDIAGVVDDDQRELTRRFLGRPRTPAPDCAREGESEETGR